MADADGLIPNADAAADIAGRKVGPFPLYVWLAGAVVAVGIGAWILRRRSGSSTSSTDGEAVTPWTPTNPHGNPSTPFTGGFAVGSPAGSTSSAPSDVPGWSAPSLTTNTEWRQSAMAYAIGAGFTGTLAESAIGKFLGGQGLTNQERAIVDTVLRHVGPTPEPVPPPFNDPSPTPDNTDTGTPPAAAVGNDPTKIEHSARVTWSKPDPLRGWAKATYNTGWVGSKTLATARANEWIRDHVKPAGGRNEKVEYFTRRVPL